MKATRAPSAAITLTVVSIVREWPSTSEPAVVASAPTERSRQARAPTPTARSATEIIRSRPIAFEITSHPTRQLDPSHKLTFTFPLKALGAIREELPNETVARIPLRTRAVDGIIVSHHVVWTAIPASL